MDVSDLFIWPYKSELLYFMLFFLIKLLLGHPSFKQKKEMQEAKILSAEEQRVRINHGVLP